MPQKKRYMPHKISFLHSLRLRFALWRASHSSWVVHEPDCPISANLKPNCNCRKQAN